MSRHRVFFGLWPTPEMAEHLAALGQSLGAGCGGRVIPAAQLHLTLAFIGHVATDRLAAVEAAAAAVRGEAFTLRLDRLGFWPQGGILWAGCGALPYHQRRLWEPLSQLHDALQTTLDAAGFPVSGRPFVPHVTLARGIRCASLPRLGTPLEWRVDEFALIESVPCPLGADYVTRARFALEDD